MADNLTSKVEIETSSAEKNIEELGRKFQGVFKTMQDVAQRLNISDRIGPVLDSIPGKLATIREGASNVKDKFEELVSTAEKNAKSFERLATVGVGAVSGIVVGLALLIVRASETDDRLSRLAEAVGTTKEKMAGLSAAAEISGAGLETLERVLIRTTEAAREQVLSDRQLRFAKDDLGREYQKTTNQRAAEGDRRHCRVREVLLSRHPRQHRSSAEASARAQQVHHWFREVRRGHQERRRLHA
jgi:hypothetical protein